MIKNLNESKIIPIIIEESTDVDDIVLSAIKAIEKDDYDHIYLDNTLLKDMPLKNIRSLQSLLASKKNPRNSIIIIRYSHDFNYFETYISGHIKTLTHSQMKKFLENNNRVIVIRNSATLDYQDISLKLSRLYKNSGYENKNTQEIYFYRYGKWEIFSLRFLKNSSISIDLKKDYEEIIKFNGIYRRKSQMGLDQAIEVLE